MSTHTHTPTQCNRIAVLRKAQGLAPLADCWLHSNPAVAASLRWQVNPGPYEIEESDSISYPQWPQLMKDQLQAAVEVLWTWHENFGRLRPQPDDIEYPPQNLYADIGNDNLTPITIVSHDWARAFYLQYVAHSLVVEMARLVPWSLRNYNNEQLRCLFDSGSIFALRPGTPVTFMMGVASHGHANYKTRPNNRGGCLAATPRQAWTFLRRKPKVALTRLDTIVNLLNWCRDNMVHFVGGITLLNMENHWGYRGLPPLTKVYNGTIRQGETQIRHWTAGCTGTTGFLKQTLRAVNIPVHIQIICGHAVPCFISESRYLSHGDDPYNSLFKASGKSGADLLLDQETFVNFFGKGTFNQDFNCENVGAGVDLAISE